MRFLYLILTLFLVACAPTVQTDAPSPQGFNTRHVTLDFIGPETAEDATPNPFTTYALTVNFRQGETLIPVRGYFAGDGAAAETSATAGRIWRIKFAPPAPGVWTWTAEMNAPLDRTTGQINVAPESVVPVLRRDGRYLRFSDGTWFLKGGANSPENFLAYDGFDGTYRIGVADREGESKAGAAVHQYTPHILDWQADDPSWQGGKGKGIIGAVNYLSDQGMNAVYFLTFNIDGDGKDVWPFADPTDMTRFDVSKLDQWDIVFDHMQAKGIALHIVLQETENELTMDDGETGEIRQLYLRELIARFGHHPALIWNIGEENGPVFWRPEGQTDDQRRDMIRFIREADPYDHPIVLHTHSEPADKTEIAGPLLGLPELDGLSFQVSDRRRAPSATKDWLSQSKATGQPWLITMDEIGMWHTGAKPDAMDPRHDSLRRYALWGHLFAGGAGVEWYFGARFPSNDLTTENWRTRENLWQQTRVALTFFDDYLPWWNMNPCGGVIDRPDSFCFGNEDIRALYLIEGGTGNLTLPEGTWDVHWFDPVAGGPLSRGTVERVSGGQSQLGFAVPADGRDRVVLLRRLP